MNSSNGVLLTLNNVGLSEQEFLTDVYFNINPADSAHIPNLTFTYQSGSAGLTLPTIQTGEDGFKADGDGKYDIDLSFTSANMGRFGPGNSITYLISGISGLTAADFEYLSTSSGGEAGPFYAAAHVQGIGSNGADSGWIEPNGGPILLTAPEPGPAGVMALAAALLGFRVWLRRARA